MNINTRCEQHNSPVTTNIPTTQIVSIRRNLPIFTPNTQRPIIKQHHILSRMNIRQMIRPMRIKHINLHIPSKQPTQILIRPHINQDNSTDITLLIGHDNIRSLLAFTPNTRCI